MVDMETLGWNEFFEKEFAHYNGEKYLAGRVMSEFEGYFHVLRPEKEYLAKIAGKLHYAAKSREDFPVVGDWVVINRIAPDDNRTLINGVLPRSSKFSRKVPGENIEEQLVAANLDLVFIVAGLDADYNLRRIERFLVTAFENELSPVVLLNKADLCEDAAAKVAEVQAISAGAPVIAISSSAKTGYEQLTPYLKKGTTVGFLGSSGVGKSTIINNLVGYDIQKVSEVRESDSKGRHTTTNRQIFILPDGCLLLDTPGMREFQLWDTDEGVKDTFTDIDEIGRNCRFSNCRHETEPGCAVREAAEQGKLDPHRLDSYRKLRKELDFLQSQQTVQGRLKRRAEERQRSKSVNTVMKLKGRK